MTCKPIHAEFSRNNKNSYGVKTTWLFECTYNDPLFKSNQLVYIRIDGVMSSGQIAMGNFNEIKSDKGVNWLMGSNKAFLSNGLLEENSLRCE